MSSAVVSTSAALGRPFVFDEENPDVCSPASASRAALDRTAPSTSLRAGEGGSPQINLQGVQESAIARVFQSTIKNQQSTIPPITPASQLDIRPAPEIVSSGVSALDALTGGLPRGCLTEICGPASSGRTTLLLAAVAAATRRGEYCAVVDASDALDPQSAAAAGVELERLLWVRCGEDSKDRSRAGCPISRASLAREMGTCNPKIFRPAFDFDRSGLKENGPRQSEHRLEQVLRATDLLLESGGFGLIVLDLGDLPPQAARHIPLTTWFRFRRAVEYTPTILLAIEQHPIAGSCSSLLLQLGPAAGPADEIAAERRKNAAHGASRGLAAGDDAVPEGRNKICTSEQSTVDPDNIEPPHAQLLTGLNITAELIRSRLDRKPARSVAFETKTAWAG
jgi:recombination protein RecA